MQSLFVQSSYNNVPSVRTFQRSSYVFSLWLNDTKVYGVWNSGVPPLDVLIDDITFMYIPYEAPTS
jgi:hypothetical protein